MFLNSWRLLSVFPCYIRLYLSNSLCAFHCFLCTCFERRKEATLIMNLSLQGVTNEYSWQTWQILRNPYWLNRVDFILFVRSLFGGFYLFFRLHEGVCIFHPVVRVLLACRIHFIMYLSKALLSIPILWYLFRRLSSLYFVLHISIPLFSRGFHHQALFIYIVLQRDYKEFRCPYQASDPTSELSRWSSQIAHYLSKFSS